MINTDAIKKILAIEENVILSPDDMARDLKITFFPQIGKDVDKNIIDFTEKLRKTFIESGVQIFNYNDCLEKVSLLKRLRRVLYIIINNIGYITHKILGQKKDGSYYIPASSLKRIVRGKRVKKGYSIIALGELDPSFLPMQFISGFKHNSIIHVVKFPDGINHDSDFQKHYQKAMSLFSYHMANIVICVDAHKWMLYNFNASHPIFERNSQDFKYDILHALIPKIYAPISPNKLSEFLITEQKFDTEKSVEKEIIDELYKGAQLFDRTGLFPEGKKINDLPFRDNFHKFIGKMHLDNRNGMSFGFIAKQMPSVIEKLTCIETTSYIANDKGYYYDDLSQLNIILKIGEKGTFSMKVPSVWVMTLRSGSNKTKFDRKSDPLKIGLHNGKMLMQFPKGVKIKGDYKPSFDTKVILAHAIGNSIIASILNHFNKDSNFIETFSKSGMSIVHWHGYMNSASPSLGLVSYGHSNPHVACSSPQSAIYALQGKLETFIKTLALQNDFSGDVHVEPHHGINVSFPSIVDLANFILENPTSTSLGNKFLLK